MTWTSADITRTLDEMRTFGDDFTLVEVKAATGGLPESLPATLCAFANMPQGGTIILGADQRRNFEITGVDAPGDMTQALISQVRSTVVPAPPVDTYPVSVNGKTVIVAEVSGLSPSQKPARYKGRAYLRQADGDYEMNPNDLRMIEIDRLHETERTQYDLVPVPGTSSSDLDQELLPGYLESVRQASRRLRSATDEDILLATSVTTPEGTLTTAGLYALGYFPQGRLPSLEVTAAVRLPHDGSGSRTSNRQDFEGPLPAMLEDIDRWILSNTGSSDVYRQDGNMEHRPEFPPRMIRELVANALVHRDLGPSSLGAGGRVQIRVSREHLVIVSPGGLQNLSASELSSGQFRPRPVNQRLYQIVKRLTTGDGAGVIEGEGGGVREALAEARDADLHRPKFIDRGVELTVLLHRGQVFSDADRLRLSVLAPGISLTHIQKSLLLSLDAGESWTTSRMLNEFAPLTMSEADRQVAPLQQTGLVTVTPEGIRLTRRSGVRGSSSCEADSSLISEQELRGITRNGPAVFAALPESRPVSVHDLADRTGLSLNSLRYALSKLVDAGHVMRSGGQGDRETTYRRA